MKGLTDNDLEIDRLQKAIYTMIEKANGEKVSTITRSVESLMSEYVDIVKTNKAYIKHFLIFNWQLKKYYQYPPYFFVF